MQRKKALLLAIGGRVHPDILAIECVRPDLLVILTTEEGCREEGKIRDFAYHFNPDMKILDTVSVESYMIERIRQKCMDIVDDYAFDEWDWVFSIGSCPKIMGIAVYEVAQRVNRSCIHMDTQHCTIISLVKDIGISSEDFFHMSVQDYMERCSRTPKPFTQAESEYRAKVEPLEEVVEQLALLPEAAEFLQIMRDVPVGREKELPEHISINSRLIKTLCDYNSIALERTQSGSYKCFFPNEHMQKLIGTGKWLELYVWHQAKKAGFADDVQWG